MISDHNHGSVGDEFDRVLEGRRYDKWISWGITLAITIYFTAMILPWLWMKPPVINQ